MDARMMLVFVFALLALAHPLTVALALGFAVAVVAALAVLIVRKIAREGARCVPRPVPWRAVAS